MAERDPKTGRFPKGNGAGGKGWGGPAKGASTSRIEHGDPAGITRTNRGRDIQEVRREKVLNLYESVVDDPKQPVMARITAGDKLLDRIDGKPVQTNVNLNKDDLDGLSDAELAAELARQRAAGTAPAAGDAAASNPAGPDGVVH